MIWKQQKKNWDGKWIKPLQVKKFDTLISWSICCDLASNMVGYYGNLGCYANSKQYLLLPFLLLQARCVNYVKNNIPQT